MEDADRGDDEARLPCVLLAEPCGCSVTEQFPDLARDAENALASVRSSAKRCLNTSTTSSTPGKYGAETSRLDYHATINAEANTLEVAVQMHAANMIGDFPEGGPYIFVGDVEQGADGAATVTVYAGGKGRDIMEPFLAWASGKSEKCPDL